MKSVNFVAQTLANEVPSPLSNAATESNIAENTRSKSQNDGIVLASKWK